MAPKKTKMKRKVPKLRIPLRYKYPQRTLRSEEQYKCRE
jgi:hypothetical protein